jgi:predicted ABC-type ATPase
MQRVAQRVARGGHHIPDDMVARRYVMGLHNMRHMFLPLADAAAIYDNSTEPPVLIAEKESASSFTVRDTERWKLIEDATGERLHE